MRRRLSVAAPFPSLILQRHRMCAIRVWARPVDPAASAANVRAGSGCDQRCARPIFNDPARARWVRFARSSFFCHRAGVVLPRQPKGGLVLSESVFWLPQSAGSPKAFFAPCFSSCLSLACLDGRKSDKAVRSGIQADILGGRRRRDVGSD